MANVNVYRGYGVRTSFGGSFCDFDQISIDMQVDDIPAVGFEDVASDGFTYDDGAMGIIGHTLAGGGYWDAALNPHANSPNFRPGLYLQNSQVFLAKPSGPYGSTPPNLPPVRFYQYPTVRCLGGRTSAQIRGRVRGQRGPPAAHSGRQDRPGRPRSRPESDRLGVRRSRLRRRYRPVVRDAGRGRAPGG